MGNGNSIAFRVGQTICRKVGWHEKFVPFSQPGVWRDMGSSYRLPLSFEADRLQADLGKVRPEEWVAHYNTRDYEGEWHGVALRAVGGNAALISANLGEKRPLADTPVLARCPYLQAVLAQFQCPLLSVRLLRLRAGAVIREHCDPRLGFQEGEVRLHIP